MVRDDDTPIPTLTWRVARLEQDLKEGLRELRTEMQEDLKDLHREVKSLTWRVASVSALGVILAALATAIVSRVVGSM